ncbi:MAG TPA: diguanylate cyclase [Gemmataceae bacterium]|jgi:diguanylate cyclase (GGDEF)-like protein|nr:diguanylate cyclase [Gemmataceae bacterium]
MVVDDEAPVLTTVAALLAGEFDVLAVTSAEAAQRVFAARDVDVLLADQHLPGMAGVQLLEWVRQHSPQTIRLLMTGLGTLEDAVQAINCGRVHRYLFKPWRSDELLLILREAARTLALERSNAQLLEETRRLNLELEERVRLRTRELEEANGQLQQKNGLLEKLALTDPLTGLPNRRASDALVQAEIQRRARYPSALALGVIDVDHFKEVNARYLLPGGDQVLVGLAKTFTASLRAVDSVGRIGGEEFLVVAPETGAAGARVLAERIRAGVEAGCFHYKHDEIRVTVSVGFAAAGAGVTAEYDLFKHVAAAALDEAKTGGRNQCRVYELGPGP